MGRSGACPAMLSTLTATRSVSLMVPRLAARHLRESESAPPQIGYFARWLLAVAAGW